MTYELRIGEIVNIPGLPLNYMPAALAARRGEPNAPARVVMELRNWIAGQERDEAMAVTFFVAHADTQSDPSAMVEFVSRREPAGDGPFYLGPPSGLTPRQNEYSINFPMTLARTSIELPNPSPKSVAIIDLGIAFWNPAFRDAQHQPLFRSVTQIDFDAQGNSTVGRLPVTSISSLCQDADNFGQTLVIQKLAAAFTGSLFAAEPDPDAFRHGTAVADIASGPGIKTEDMFAIELPYLALTDYGGDTLQLVLHLALSVAVFQALHDVSKPLVIVLPFGFPGGPQDGSHPVARVVDGIIAFANLIFPNGVHLILPAGNHLQDRCHAVLTPILAGPPPSIIWRIAPDDFSPNCVEICLYQSNIPAVTLTSPDGQSATFSLDSNDYADIICGQDIIGGVHRWPDLYGWTKLRITLAPTAWRPGCPAPAPFGDWKLHVSAKVDAQLWILRDDTNHVAQQGAPHRPSVFFDPEYRERNDNGDYCLDDSTSGKLRRSGTASLLTSAQHQTTAQANERIGGIDRPAFYSGRASGVEIFQSARVDDGWELRGVEALGNGTARIFSFSGTSAAAAILARDKI